jgi:putative toxin-antitoxin system antitoxin component (TIGR02293 family)
MTSLPPDESEQNERLARVSSIAMHVFDDEEKARQFLSSPHPLLQGVKPSELAKTDAGTSQVEALLWSIYYGLPV